MGKWVPVFSEEERRRELAVLRELRPGFRLNPGGIKHYQAGIFTDTCLVWSGEQIICACAWTQTGASTSRAATRALEKKGCPELIAQSFLLLVDVFSDAEKRTRENLGSTDIKSLSRIADALDLRTRVASY